MFDSVEAFLSRLHHPMLASIDLSLDRMHRLLRLLGSPERRLPPVIHVAGTNGKGSLIANLQSIFEAAGLRAHRYISPHLVHFRERIVLSGREIDDAYLASILKHMAPVLAAQPATFFEAATAAAFLAFAEHKADVLLMETGMGGRLDATNVIEKPVLAAITPISFDHMEYLGHTLGDIAGEKAGIIKAGVACVVGRQPPEAAAAIAARAIGLVSPLYRHGVEWNWIRQGDKALYQSEKRSMAFAPGLLGNHQYDNAATALACIDQLPFAISDTHIAQGLANAAWPARLQDITAQFSHILPRGMSLMLDGGHNAEGGRVLAEWMAEQRGKEIHVICGMIKSKDAAAFLKPLAAHAKSLVAVAIPGETQSQPALAIEAAARIAGMEALSAESVEKALQTILARAKTPAVICICGSLYLAGKILAATNMRNAA